MGQNMPIASERRIWNTLVMVSFRYLAFSECCKKFVGVTEIRYMKYFWRRTPFSLEHTHLVEFSSSSGSVSSSGGGGTDIENVKP